MEDLGSEINYFDPYVPRINIGDLNHKKLGSLEISKIANYDAIAIVTDHDNVNYDLLIIKWKINY